MNLKIVILFVGGTLITCIGSITVLTALHDTPPDILTNVAIGSLTGLVGLLVKPGGDTPPLPVPVPVTPVSAVDPSPSGMAPNPSPNPTPAPAPTLPPVI